MTTKEYLSQAFVLDKRLQTKQRRLEWLKNRASYVSANLHEAVQSSPSHRSAVEEAVVRIISLEEEIANDITRIVQLKQEIASAIRRVNNIECETLLEMRYLSFLRWEEIASQLNYSQGHVYHLHRRALKLVKVSA